MISMDVDGYVTYCGRADDMLKVSGKCDTTTRARFSVHPAGAASRYPLASLLAS